MAYMREEWEWDMCSKRAFLADIPLTKEYRIFSRLLRLGIVDRMGVIIGQGCKS